MNFSRALSAHIYSLKIPKKGLGNFDSSIVFYAFFLNSTVTAIAMAIMRATVDAAM